jgi:uncharacterized membrane protein YagU involved in acid resistance
MDFISAIIAGLVGTLVMTILMYLAPLMGMPKMDIIGMLGTMFSTNRGTARIIGIIVHFMMGAVFGIIYAFLWSLGIGSPTWVWGLIFGFVHAILFMIAMPVMMNMHPCPPEMERNTLSVVGQLMGHMAFGLVVALTYAALV